MKDIKHQMEDSDTTPKNIKKYKVNWVDQLPYKKMKLEKMYEKRNRIKDNANFKKHQKTLEE